MARSAKTIQKELTAVKAAEAVTKGPMRRPLTERRLELISELRAAEIAAKVRTKGRTPTSITGARKSAVKALKQTAKGRKEYDLVAKASDGSLGKATSAGEEMRSSHGRDMGPDSEWVRVNFARSHNTMPSPAGNNLRMRVEGDMPLILGVDYKSSHRNQCLRYNRKLAHEARKLGQEAFDIYCGSIGMTPKEVRELEAQQNFAPILKGAADIGRPREDKGGKTCLQQGMQGPPSSSFGC